MAKKMAESHDNYVLFMISGVLCLLCLPLNFVYNNYLYGVHACTPGTLINNRLKKKLSWPSSYVF